MDRQTCVPALGGAPASGAFAGLTAREKELLELIAHEQDNAQIAARLELSDKTVRNHITTIFAKLQVEGRAQAIIRARDAGYARQPLFALARKQPGKLNFGSGAKGIQSHISAEMFKSATGANIVHIPYKGTVLAVSDLVAGQIQMVFADMVPAMPHIKAGRLRPLAVTTESRSPVLPDVPTMIESGVPGYRSGVWWAVVAPKGTPDQCQCRCESSAFGLRRAGDCARWHLSATVTPVRWGVVVARAVPSATPFVSRHRRSFIMAVRKSKRPLNPEVSHRVPENARVYGTVRWDDTLRGLGGVEVVAPVGAGGAKAVTAKAATAIDRQGNVLG